MTDHKLEWLKARCPICGQEYRHLKEYKPATCGKFACLHKYLHPELSKGRVYEQTI